jgi:hypothetical protein
LGRARTPLKAGNLTDGDQHIPAVGILFGAQDVDIVEKFESGDDADGLSMRLAARHDHTFTETARCWAAVEYLPELDDVGRYLLNTELGTEAALNSTLSLRVVLQDRYDSEPPADLDENDLALIAALVYKP